MTLYIKGLGHFTPPGRITNADLEKMVDTNDEWITTRTGIRERAVAGKGVASSDLALEAAKAAILDAGMTADDIDAVVVSTCTPDMTMPGSSSFLQAKLGTREVPAFDMNAACSGFVYGISVAEGLLATGRYKNILLAAVDKFSSTVNYKDRGTCILFGDGAGSVVVSTEAGGPRLTAAHLGGNGDLARLLWRPAGGSLTPPQEAENPDDLYVKMEGSEVFKHAVRGMGIAADKVLDIAGWTRDQVDWLVPHQANIRLIDSAMRRLKLPKEKVITNIDRYGNMSAASIPVAMSEAREKFRSGDKLVSVAFGAGFTWGGLAFEWERFGKDTV